MSYLEEIYRHNDWATRALLEHCAGLDADVLERSAPGTYGTIIATLRHLSGAEERYLSRLEGTSPRAEAMEPANLGVEALLAEAAGRAERWQKVLPDLPGPETAITYVTGDGERREVSTATLVVQAVHHANDHRTHICSILGAAGLDVPDLDGWSFYGES